jgi:uncharacterized protein involved in exopolysaccharide biosynthesis
MNTPGRNGASANGNGHARLGKGTPVDTRVSPQDETSLRDVYRILFRHKRKMICFFTVTILATLAYAFFFPKAYHSEAKLFVRLGRENVGLDATTTFGQSTSVAVPVQRDEEINTEVEVLKSRQILDRVVDAIGPSAILAPGVAQQSDSDAKNSRSWLEALGLVVPLSPHEKALNYLEKHVGVDAVKKTNIILVSCDAPTAQLSQQVVTRLIEYYLDLHGTMSRSAHAHEFLGQQASVLKGQLNTLENEFRLLKNSTGLASPAEQRQILVTRNGRLEDELKTTTATIAATSAEASALRQQLSQLDQTQLLTKADGMPNAAADLMRQQLYALQLKEKDLASRFTDRHVELRAVREQLASAKAIVDSLEQTRTQYTRGPNRAYEELRLTLLRQESALASLGAKASTLKTQLAAGTKELETLNNNETRIGQLQREIQIRDVSYHKYSDSLEQSRIDESLQKERISNINIAETPTLNRLPIRPRPSLALLLGFAFAVLGSVCVAITAEYLDHTLKTSTEVESRLNLPVLVSIPRIASDRITRSSVQN